MFFYSFLLLFCLIALIINEKIKYNQKKYIEIITLTLLIVISGTRYHLGGSDYVIYKSVFDSLPRLKDFLLNYKYIHSKYLTFGFEIGYLFINSFVKSLGFNFYGFTLFHSIFFYTSMYIGLKKYIYNFNFFIIIFLYKLFFYNTFISLRQSITLAIFFLSIKFIEEKKTIKYFISIAIASLFHTAALILFPIYFINIIKLNKKKIVILNIIFIPTLLISLIKFNILQYFRFIINLLKNPVAISKVENLFFGDITSSISLFHTLEYFLIMIIILKNFNKLVNVNDNSIKLFLVLLPLFTLFRNYEILTRFKDFFTFTYAIILNNVSNLDGRSKKILIYFFTILISSYGFYRFILLFDNGALIPYESYLFKDISIFLSNIR